MAALSLNVLIIEKIRIEIYAEMFLKFLLLFQFDPLKTVLYDLIGLFFQPIKFLFLFGSF